jgi:predicted dehydrogenase
LADEASPNYFNKSEREAWILTMSRLKAVVVGAGLISQKKHIPAFLRAKGKVELAAVCDLNLDAAKTVASKFGIPKAYGDLGEMLEKEKPDLVDVCTPPQTHVKLAVLACQKGSHLMIEKPMAMTVAECDRIVDAATKAGVKVCVGHSDLFYYPFEKARKLVEAGAIGEFRGMRIFLSTPSDYMTAKENHWAHKLAGGVIGETGPHIAYMTLAFMRPICDVNVSSMKMLDYPWSRCEDYRIDLIGAKAISSIVLSYSTNQWSAKVDILGSTGLLKLDLEDLSLVRYNRTELSTVTAGMSLLSESAQLVGNAVRSGFRLMTGRHTSTHDLLLNRFVDAIQHGGPSPVPPEDGRETVRVLDMIVKKLDAQWEPESLTVSAR